MTHTAMQQRLEEVSAEIPFAHGFMTLGPAPAAVGECDRVFPLASVTKPIVCWSALVAVEQGLLDLDDPADPELLPGATLVHLMSHSSGIDFDSDTVIAPVATRRIYSNRGIELLGAALERATAMPLEAWVRQSVLDPLGMTATAIPGSPAHSGRGTVRDCAAFVAELLTPRLISLPLAELARTPMYEDLAGILPGFGKQDPNPFGLGFEIRGHKQPHWSGEHNSPATFGHFGQSGSLIWADPQAGCGLAFAGEVPFGKAHRAVWPRLNDAVVSAALAQ